MPRRDKACDPARCRPRPPRPRLRPPQMRADQCRDRTRNRVLLPTDSTCRASHFFAQPKIETPGRAFAQRKKHTAQNLRACPAAPDRLAAQRSLCPGLATRRSRTQRPVAKQRSTLSTWRRRASDYVAPGTQKPSLQSQPPAVGPPLSIQRQVASGEGNRRPCPSAKETDLAE